MTVECSQDPHLGRPLPIRLWIYQRERFPFLAHGIPIAALSVSALGVSTFLTSRTGELSSLAIVTAFLTVFAFFLQLRIADEFKDHDDDLRYRPYRAVPRGLVSLRELAWIGVIGGVIQLALALWLDARLVWLLFIVWGYFALMSVEFFAGSWLKAHPVTYLWSHMLILPLIVLYATACDWLVNGVTVSLGGLIGFLLMCMFNGVVFEIGRKIRAPEDEEEGVETYSALWGGKRSTAAWGGALVLSALASIWAAAHIDFMLPVAAVSGILLALAAFLANRFIRSPSTKTAKAIDTMSGLWMLSLLLVLGVIPMGFAL
jgi:4-hydroxybenzoate polyprenyltransferase